MFKEFNIVIADDDNDDQMFIKRAIAELNEKQVRVTSVFDGNELMSYLSKNGSFRYEDSLTPDLVILDINMPKMNGIEAFIKIKSDAALKNIPVFILTTSQTPADKESTNTLLGENHYYIKPNTSIEYKTIIEKMLRSSKTDRS